MERITKWEIEKNLSKLKNRDSKVDYLEELKKNKNLDEKTFEFVESLLKDIYREIAEDHLKKGELRDALEYFKRAGEGEESKKIKEIYKKMGERAVREGRFYDATTYFKKAGEMQELIKIAEIFEGKTSEKREDEDYSTRKNLYMAAKIYEEIAGHYSTLESAQFYEKAGECYEKIGEGKKAIEMYKKAEKIKEEKRKKQLVGV